MSGYDSIPWNSNIFAAYVDSILVKIPPVNLYWPCKTRMPLIFDCTVLRFRLALSNPYPPHKISPRVHTQPSFPKRLLQMLQEQILTPSGCTHPSRTAATPYVRVRQQRAAAGCPEPKSLAWHVCSSHQDLGAYFDFTAALISKHISNLTVEKSG